mmetsp:Transcript_28321/g.65571  ORF Transcript_28321/g.65571 Transcript_28321/m.65571 type:complete len:253 (-) Transcript_28321:509-1267(-)
MKSSPPPTQKERTTSAIGSRTRATVSLSPLVMDARSTTRTSCPDLSRRPTAPEPMARTTSTCADPFAFPLWRFDRFEASKTSSGLSCPESALSSSCATRPCEVATDTQPAFTAAPATETSAMQSGSTTIHRIDSPLCSHWNAIGAEREVLATAGRTSGLAWSPPPFAPKRQLVIRRPWPWRTMISHCCSPPQAMAASSSAWPRRASQPVMAAKFASPPTASTSIAVSRPPAKRDVALPCAGARRGRAVRSAW